MPDSGCHGHLHHGKYLEQDDIVIGAIIAAVTNNRRFITIFNKNNLLMLNEMLVLHFGQGLNIMAVLRLKSLDNLIEIYRSVVVTIYSYIH